MFAVIFRPGPRVEGPFTADLTGKGHAPLLFLWFDPATERATWVTKFTHCHLFASADDALRAIATKEKLEAVMGEAFSLMGEAVTGLAKEVPVQGSVAVMPLQFGPAAFAGFATP